MPVVCAAVIGQQNNPLFLQLYDGPNSHHQLQQQQQHPLLQARPAAEARFQHMVHAALDAIEEKVLLRRAPGEVPEAYLGLLLPTEEYRVFGYITNTHIKMVLVLDEAAPRESALQATFKRLHGLWVDAASNPLYMHGLPLRSEVFAQGVAGLVAAYNSSAAAA